MTLECSLHRDASSPEEYQLVEGYAEGVQDVVQGYQAKVAGLGQSTTTRHPGGRGGGKRGGKVSCLTLSCLMRTCCERVGPLPASLGKGLLSLCSKAPY